MVSRQLQASADNCSDRRLRRQKTSVNGALNTEGQTACVLCVSPTCSNCRVDRTLEAIDERKLKLIEHSVVVCRPAWCSCNT
ncbi:hypothetical protein GQ600_27017 [Phytophthora cactorum]|nr:hypothetical protein GQ600_27017 [Phytophthora cactorum]